MDLSSVLILSIVEGLTEFLPISSTAHLMITARLIGLPATDFLSSFQIFIQLGAILAVGFLYSGRLVKNPVLLKKVAIAFLPTAAVGFILYPLIKNLLLSSLATVATALFIGGAVLILFELWYAQKKEMNTRDLTDLSYKEATIIGFFQALAVVPGVSRAGATIIGGLTLGLSRVAIVEFSFLLALPTMLAATVYDLFKTGTDFDFGQYGALALGFALSFIFAFIAVKWLLAFIQHHSFIWFGAYRLALAMFIWFFIL